jgi:hypothetical protein
MTDKPNIPPRKPGEGSRDYRKRISGGTYKNPKANKPKPKPTDKIPSDMEEFYKGPSKEVIEERQKAIDKIRRGNPTNEEIEEAKREADYEAGDYLLPDEPSNAFTNRDILKILQHAASVRPYQQVGGSLFKALTIQQLGGYR